MSEEEANHSDQITSFFQSHSCNFIIYKFTLRPPSSKCDQTLRFFTLCNKRSIQQKRLSSVRCQSEFMMLSVKSL